MKFKAVCNMARKAPSGAEDASFRVFRSHLNQLQYAHYPCGTEFEFEFESEAGLWLKDSDKATIYVPLGEKQCFERIED